MQRRPVLFWLITALEIGCVLLELASLFIAFIVSPVRPADLWPLLVPPAFALAIEGGRLRVSKSTTWRRSLLIWVLVWAALLILGAIAIYVGGGGSKYFFNLQHHTGGFQM